MPSASGLPFEAKTRRTYMEWTEDEEQRLKEFVRQNVSACAIALKRSTSVVQQKDGRRFIVRNLTQERFLLLWVFTVRFLTDAIEQMIRRGQQNRLFLANSDCDLPMSKERINGVESTFSEEDIQREQLGQKGVPGKPDQTKMTPQREKKTPEDVDPGHTASIANLYRDRIGVRKPLDSSSVSALTG